jgi:hypothetical protein
MISSSKLLLRVVQLAKEAPPQILLLAAVSAKAIWPVTGPATSGVKPSVKVQMSPAAIVKLNTEYIGGVPSGMELAAQFALERKNWFENEAG